MNDKITQLLNTEFNLVTFNPICKPLLGISITEAEKLLDLEYVPFPIFKFYPEGPWFMHSDDLEHFISGLRIYAIEKVKENINALSSRSDSTLH